MLYCLYKSLTFSIDLVMANSSWTLGHLKSTWCFQKDMALVFPPCNTEAFTRLPLEAKRRPVVMSFA